jgi:SAM-dependent methyltransferase
VSDRWAEVWEGRRLDPAHGSVLAQLMAADGLDTSFGSVGEESWRGFVESVRNDLGLRAGDSVFEIGCGAGGFLYELHRAGLQVGGVDRSASLVACAREVMPGGDFAVGDADTFVPAQPADAVVSCGVFMYFPSLGYAERVVARMAASARRAVAILDVPDDALREEALAERREALGGDEAYADRYAGLEHLYYDRRWLADVLGRHGLVDVRVTPQRVEGYANGRFRFNVWGAVRPAR